MFDIVNSKTKERLIYICSTSTNMYGFALFLSLCLLLNIESDTLAQEEVSFLDDQPILTVYRNLHKQFFNYVGPNSENPERLKQARSQGVRKWQLKWPHNRK